MEINRLRSIIRESINNNLKEIEDVAENAAMEAKLNAYTEAIEKVNKKIEMAESLEEMQELVDPTKLNELKKHLKTLEKSKEKLEKVKAKKNKGKEIVTDEPTEDTVDEGSYYNEDMNLGEEDLTPEESEELRKKAEQNPSQALPEAFLKMQKLAGVITEAQYNKKKSLIENQLSENKIGDLIKKVFSKSEKQEDKPIDDKITQQADAIVAQAEREAAQKKKAEDLAKFTTELDKNQRLQELLEAYLEVMHEYDSLERFDTMQHGSFNPPQALESSLTTAKNNLYNYAKSKGIDTDSISGIFYSLQDTLKKAKEATKARYKA
jgi:hypothetical protein